MPHPIQMTPLDLNNPEHIECMFHVRTHPEVTKFLPGSPPATFIQHTQYLNSVKNKQFYLIACNGMLCGYCQATEAGAELELGWALHPDHWGKGIGRQAVEQLVAMTLPQKKQLILFVQRNNPRALSLYQSCGFAIDAEYVHPLQFKMVL